MSDMLPCPFCGTARVIYEEKKIDEHWIHCDNRNANCDCTLGPFPTKREAKAAWNRRVAEEPKWTKEPPTREGWYWLKDVNNKPKIVYYKFGQVCFLTDSCVFGPVYEYWTEHIEEFGENVQWCKIDIPALLEEGGDDL